MVTYLGSLFQSCCGEGGTLQTNIIGVCGECSQCFSCTVAPTHGMCAFPVYTAQAPGCSAGNSLRQALGCVHFPGLSHSGSGSRVLPKGADSFGPAFCALPRSKPLRFRFSGTPQGHRLSWACFFVPLPGPSSSVNPVLGEHTVPVGLCILITSQVLATQFPGCTMRAPSQVRRVSPLWS